MANLQIKDLPEDLHDELRRRARLEGVSIRTYILKLIESDQARPPRSEWWRRIRSRRPVDTGGPVADLVSDDRRQRDERYEAGRLLWSMPRRSWNYSSGPRSVDVSRHS